MTAILFENSDYLAINKPEGISSIPDRSGNRQDLLSTLSQDQKLFVVHRLDKEVSGVILFAKNAEAHKFMNDRFESREVKKTYMALIHGALKEPFGRVHKSIREFGSGRMGVDDERGKVSTTDYEVTEERGPYTLLKARPITGRRHQIRVHFYSIGHPIVGDPRYGDPAVQNKFPRLMLHSHKLEFTDADGQLIIIDAPLAPSFRQFLDPLPKNQ